MRQVTAEVSLFGQIRNPALIKTVDHQFVNHIKQWFKQFKSTWCFNHDLVNDNDAFHLPVPQSITVVGNYNIDIQTFNYLPELAMFLYYAGKKRWRCEEHLQNQLPAFRVRRGKSGESDGIKAGKFAFQKVQRQTVGSNEYPETIADQ